MPLRFSPTCLRSPVALVLASCRKIARQFSSVVIEVNPKFAWACYRPRSHSWRVSSVQASRFCLACMGDGRSAAFRGHSAVQANFGFSVSAINCYPEWLQMRPYISMCRVPRDELPAGPFFVGPNRPITIGIVAAVSILPLLWTSVRMAGIQMLMLNRMECSVRLIWRCHCCRRRKDAKPKIACNRYRPRNCFWRVSRVQASRFCLACMGDGRLAALPCRSAAQANFGLPILRAILQVFRQRL